MEKAQLDDNEWLHEIYEIRSKWVPKHVNHVFFFVEFMFKETPFGGKILKYL